MAEFCKPNRENGPLHIIIYRALFWGILRWNVKEGSLQVLWRAKYLKF